MEEERCEVCCAVCGVTSEQEPKESAREQQGALLRGMLCGEWYVCRGSDALGRVATSVSARHGAGA